MKIKKKNKMAVFNLEFFPYQSELKIGQFVISKSNDYQEQLAKLHRDYVDIREHPYFPAFPAHQITANLEFSGVLRNSILPWSRKCTELTDLSLVLSLITGRNVSMVPESVVEDGILNTDPRKHQFGFLFRASISEHWNSTYSDPIMRTERISEYEREVNRIYRLIRSRKWRNKYPKGYILLLAREVLTYQILEKSFLQAISLWEYLYGLHNPKNYNLKDPSDLEKMKRIPLNQKLTYLFREYGFISKKVKQAQYERIQKTISHTRNSLVHTGKAPYQGRSRKLEKSFIYLTEQLIAMILGCESISQLDKTKRWLNRLLYR